jgi:hypothetical protein
MSSPSSPRSARGHLALVGLALLGLGAIASPRLAAAQDRRILVLDEEVVEGRIEKPEAFYILQATNLNYDQAELTESFLPDLFRTVEEEPF